MNNAQELHTLLYYCNTFKKKKRWQKDVLELQGRTPRMEEESDASATSPSRQVTENSTSQEEKRRLGRSLVVRAW